MISGSFTLEMALPAVAHDVPEWATCIFGRLVLAVTVLNVVGYGFTFLFSLLRCPLKLSSRALSDSFGDQELLHPQLHPSALLSCQAHQRTHLQHFPTAANDFAITLFIKVTDELLQNSWVFRRRIAFLSKHLRSSDFTVTTLNHLLSTEAIVVQSYKTGFVCTEWKMFSLFLQEYHCLNHWTLVTTRVTTYQLDIPMIDNSKGVFNQWKIEPTKYQGNPRPTIAQRMNHRYWNLFRM